MKKILSLLVLLYLPVQNIIAQPIVGYNFIVTEYYDVYNEITTGTISTAVGDNGAENIILPFPFKYMGITYTTARISVNGWLQMGQSYTGPGSDNHIESTTMKPLICPLWDDLYADAQSEIRYLVTGEYPARFLTIQWKNMTWASNSNRKSFQIRLWELDGNIDFIYGPGAIVSSLSSFSIGMNNSIGGTGNFISLQPTSYTFPDISSTTPYNNNFNLELIPDDLLYSFIPEDTHSAYVYQVSDTLIPGISDQKILAVIVATHAGGALTWPWTTAFVFNTYGTTNTDDILAAKTYFTGNSPNFSTTYPMGMYPNPDGQFTVPGGNTQINNDVTYYWLAYDISPNAAYGNIIDGNCIKIERGSCCPAIYPDSTLAGAVLSVVPVELVSFSAVQNDKSVELSWITETELNNSGFEIERRDNQNNDWKLLSFINGSGTTSEPQTYHFVDNDIRNGIYYYRLKQIDLDGSYEYSNIIEVKVTLANSFSLEQNYPNPFNPSTKIRYAIPSSGFVSIRIYDVLGNEAAVLVNEEQTEGEHEIIFDAKDLTSGVYVVTLNSGSISLSRKVILLK